MRQLESSVLLEEVAEVTLLEDVSTMPLEDDSALMPLEDVAVVELLENATRELLLLPDVSLAEDSEDVAEPLDVSELSEEVVSTVLLSEAPVAETLLELASELFKDSSVFGLLEESSPQAMNNDAAIARKVNFFSM